MSEENKIGTYQFVAEPFHVDFNGRLTMGVLNRPDIRATIQPSCGKWRFCLLRGSGIRC